MSERLSDDTILCNVPDNNELGNDMRKEQVLDWAKDHYWDSLEKEKDIILKHLEAIPTKHCRVSALLGEVRLFLATLKRRHHECEDCWYSCPKCEEGCCDDRQGKDCNCDADDYNAKIDEMLAKIDAHFA